MLQVSFQVSVWMNHLSLRITVIFLYVPLPDYTVKETPRSSIFPPASS